MVWKDKMRIDITGANLQSFISIAQKFPTGIITVEDKKAYWEWDGSIQTIPEQQVGYQLNQMQRPQPQQKNAFLNMFDSMASRF